MFPTPSFSSRLWLVFYVLSPGTLPASKQTVAFICCRSGPYRSTQFNLTQLSLGIHLWGPPSTIANFQFYHLAFSWGIQLGMFRWQWQTPSHHSCFDRLRGRSRAGPNNWMAAVYLWWGTGIFLLSYGWNSGALQKAEINTKSNAERRNKNDRQQHQVYQIFHQRNVTVTQGLSGILLLRVLNSNCAFFLLAPPSFSWLLSSKWSFQHSKTVAVLVSTGQIGNYGKK